jgi:hypothetical protein
MRIDLYMVESTEATRLSKTVCNVSSKELLFLSRSRNTLPEGTRKPKTVLLEIRPYPYPAEFSPQLHCVSNVFDKGFDIILIRYLAVNKVMCSGAAYSHIINF